MTESEKFLDKILTYVDDSDKHWFKCHKADIKAYAKIYHKEQLTLTDVVKSLPNDEEVKAHIDTLPYYGTCTTEYNEGFEDGVKWLKEQLAK